MARVDPSNVQGLIFRSYNYPRTRHFFFRFADAARARGFIRRWAAEVTDADRDIDAVRPEPLVNMALTWPGLSQLMTNPAAKAAFSIDFRDPPNAHAMRDLGASAPEHWWSGRFRSEDVHLAVFLYCLSDAALATHSEAVRASAAESGLTELLPTRDHEEALTGRTPDGGVLHFGYRDGISQPQINWLDAPDRPDLVDLRHVLLGYDTGAGSSAETNAIVRDGCYLVLRWLYQDVARFNRFLRVKAQELWPRMPVAEAQELLAAKLMGRWRNGTPLVLSPDRAETEPAGILRNDFDYAADPDGVRCPFSAHIRIANRRDDPLKERDRTMFPSGTPRILRRGSTYGPPLAGEEDDGRDRGLIGMFLCANVEAQFYVLMRWINETNFHDKVTDNHGQDPLFGNRAWRDRTDRFEFQADGERRVVTGLEDFVRTQGTLILFLPSLTLLRSLG